MRNIDKLQVNGSVYTLKNGSIATYSNIDVSVTPTVLSSYNDWDTEQVYGYKADITINGITANSVILNIIMTSELLNAIAPVITTGANKITIYTEDNTSLSGTIFTLVVEEA